MTKENPEIRQIEITFVSMGKFARLRQMSENTGHYAMVMHG